MECLSLDLELNALKNKQGWRKSVKCMAERGKQDSGIQEARTERDRTRGPLSGRCSGRATAAELQNHGLQNGLG